MKLPPLHALMCFEAAGRLLSMKKAAEELHVTPGAVSQQITSLENKLERQLFVRSVRSLTLTPQGQLYLQSIMPAFSRIALATERLTAADHPHVITLSCTSGFTTQWLLPRLPAFEAQYPGCEVRINTTHRLVDLAAEGITFAVRHGSGHYPDVIADRLLDDGLIPVCSPSWLNDRERLASPQEILDAVLLHDEHRADWALWFRAIGIENAQTDQGPIFVDSNGVIEAAIAGAGIALVRQSLIGRELAEGKLVSPFQINVDSPLAYYLIYDASALLSRTNRCFRDWLLSEAAQMG
ncbi:transcriptional regulator GcvA [Dickeya solani]|uniref:Glycine cleavage system transcriptional activator n=1 Tax=Dickeya solani TaxID=1089444 RepID=A0AAX4F2Q2_9GAMM|nr:transcriptional regulator GcvA [Dickeya solani]WOA53974.1 transcriptional regulator GcvA [Dickeya solani]